MATRTHADVFIADGVVKSQWTGLLNGDDGDPLRASSHPHRSLMLRGTAGVGFAAVVEVSDDGANWMTGEDASNTSMAAAALPFVVGWFFAPHEYIRVRITAGDGTTTVIATIYSSATPASSAGGHP